MALEFGVLGPLLMRDGALPVDVPGGRQRAILAALLVRVGRFVGIDELIDTLWGDDPPETGRHQVQNGISLLRGVLARHGGTGILRSEPDGYRLSIAPDQLDLSRFESGVAEGRGLAAAGDPAGAAKVLRQALSLWRGPAFSGLGSARLEQEAERLEEMRLAALEDRIEQELACGDDGGLVAELTGLVAAYPLRERLAAALMLALYRGGQQADALSLYRKISRSLATDLGVDPGPELRRRYEEILRRDPALDRPATTANPAPPANAASPAQLPAAGRLFVGRHAHVARLNALLAGAATAPGVLIAAVTGGAGVGKTALAIHWAHSVRERFPDGQLYVNLLGHAPGPPLRSVDALTRLLRALGVPADQIPAGVEEAAASFRTALADRRVLVVLDNAADPDQVRPLLPGSAGCLVLITSRNRLGGLVALDGAEEIHLDVLAADEAATLLTRLLGAGRVTGRSDAVARLGHLCAYLPLALRIAAANLAARPCVSVDAYVGELAAGNRLAGLAVAGDDRSAVRAAFDLSYGALDAGQREVFRRLGLAIGADVTVEAAAALSGHTVADARVAIDTLAAAHLLTEHAPGRYAFHDLLRLYAAERAADEDPPEAREAAVHRLYTYYLAAVGAAGDVLYPQIMRLPPAAPTLPAGAVAAPSFGDRSEALAWLEAERPNLVATVEHTAAHGPTSVAWLLADALRGYLSHRVYAADWLAVATIARSAARSAGDRRAEAAAELSLGTFEWLQGRQRAAAGHFTEALALAIESGWVGGEVVVRGNLGSVYSNLDEMDKAVDMIGEALRLNRVLGRRLGEAANLSNLGYLYVVTGRLDLAEEYCRQAIDAYSGIGATSGEGVSLANLGQVLCLLGRIDEADAALSAALERHRSMGTRVNEAEALNSLALLRAEAGRYAEALDLARAAVEMAADIGHRQYRTNALVTIAKVHVRCGEHREALDAYESALRLADAAVYPYGRVEALTGLAGCHRLAGVEALGRAADLADEACDLAAKRGYRLLQGEALATRARIHLDRGRPDLAHADAMASIAIHEATGYETGERRGRELLALAAVPLAAVDDAGRARLPDDDRG